MAPTCSHPSEETAVFSSSLRSRLYENRRLVLVLGPIVTNKPYSINIHITPSILNQKVHRIQKTSCTSTMTTLHLLNEQRKMLEKEAITKITALDNGALKLLSDHSNSCNIDQGGACDYPCCKEAKRLIFKNAMSGEKKLSLLQQIQGRRGGLLFVADSSSRRDDDDTTKTRNSGRGGGSSSSSLCSSWKSRSRVHTETFIEEDEEEGQEMPTNSK